jgi:hypothetical protein
MHGGPRGPRSISYLARLGKAIAFMRLSTHDLMHEVLSTHSDYS